MNLHLITYRISAAKTGGDKYNQALLEGAVKAGFTVDVTPIEQLRGEDQKLLKTNFQICRKVASLPKNVILLFDAGSLPWCFMAVILNCFLKRKHSVLLLYHFPSWDSMKMIPRLMHNIIAFLCCRCFDSLLTISKWSLDTFYKFSSRNIHSQIISPFASAPEYHYGNANPKTPPLILSVGTICNRKNIHNVIIALKDVNIPFHYDIVGDTNNKKYLSYLQKLINNHGLGDKVSFCGRISDYELGIKYKSASIFTLVSFTEGYGMAYTDAMFYGLPIVASNRSAVPELIIHEQNGILCDPDNPQEISNAIVKVLTNPEISRKFSENNQQKFTTLPTRSVFIEQTRDYFTKLKSVVNK